MREEFYEALRRERAEREESFRLFEERMRRDEEGRRRDEEARRREREEWSAQMRQEHSEWTARMDRISGEWGKFTNDEGGMVEYEGILALRNLDEIGGMPVMGVWSELTASRKGREYDGLLYCPEALVLVEFKRRLTRGHVRKFLDEQLPDFLRDFPGLLNGHAFYGAVAGATVDDDAHKLAEENGLFTIRIPANRRVEVLKGRARPREV